jgi:hypothetical protein
MISFFMFASLSMIPDCQECDEFIKGNVAFLWLQHILTFVTTVKPAQRPNGAPPVKPTTRAAAVPTTPQAALR